MLKGKYILHLNSYLHESLLSMSELANNLLGKENKSIEKKAIKTIRGYQHILYDRIVILVRLVHCSITGFQLSTHFNKLFRYKNIDAINCNPSEFYQNFR